MTVDYRVVISKAATREPLAELPLQGLTFDRILSGCGSLSGTLSIWHPAATETILGLTAANPDRELTVWRKGDDGVEVPIWNGPITNIQGTMSGGVYTITAREASWYLQKRVLEEDKVYTTSDDVFDVVRDLVDYMKTKTASGDDDMTLGDDIVAALPGFSVSAGAAGATLAEDVSFAGTARHTISECFEFIAADPETGFDYRMDYSTGSTRQSVHRTLTLGYPGLGTTLTTELTEHILYDFGRESDWDRAGSRVHVVGSGYTKTLQGAGAVANGNLLLEVVDDYSDTSNHGLINHRARDLRRLAQIPVRILTASYVPGSALPFGFCDLGDVVPFEIQSPPGMTITGNTRRVVQIAVRPPEGDAPELVDLMFNQPLDELGT